MHRNMSKLYLVLMLRALLQRHSLAILLQASYYNMHNSQVH
jgi:hypothetical protein